MKLQLPEKFRITSGKFATKTEDGPNGAFIVPAPVQKFKSQCLLIMSNSLLGWEHVALRHYNTKSMKVMDVVPSVLDIAIVRRAFWEETETVIQIYPDKSLYAQPGNIVVHLWCCKVPGPHATYPLPPAIIAELFGYTLGENGLKEKERMHKEFPLLFQNGTATN